MTKQPESLESRLNRLETIFADMGDVVIAQSEAIASHKQSIDALTANINRLAELAERDRQVFQTEIQRIWQYLLQQSGNGRH